MQGQQTVQGTDSLPRDNRGYLIRCQKRHERSPDMTGECWVNQQRHEIAAWVAISKRSGRKYLNLRFAPGREEGRR
jgi:hypothetical protein